MPQTLTEQLEGLAYAEKAAKKCKWLNEALSKFASSNKKYTFTYNDLKITVWNPVASGTSLRVDVSATSPDETISYNLGDGIFLFTNPLIHIPDGTSNEIEINSKIVTVPNYKEDLLGAIKLMIYETVHTTYVNKDAN
jgi:hypothetical protein